MDIIVSIKQVPDTTEVRIDPVTNTLVREGVPTIINPFDENAIEEGLRLREKHGGKVTVITMGPPQAEQALRDALAMGVDDVILISDRKFAGADTWATSYTLAQAIRKIGKYDILLFGKQAIDGDTAQVGPGVAEQLDIPQVAYVKKIEVEGEQARVERVMEDGYEVVELKLPALFTLVKEINEPRFPSLKGKLMAKKREIPVWKVEDIDTDLNKIGLDGSPTKVIRTFTPSPRGKGEVFKGTVEEQVNSLLERLQEIKLV
ncbi:MAG: electron transfer flavoprotein subunit beta/FixA family protein [Spirochaetes bacterium]|nr:electron transfer flavoprotein subunit beta/FixA family protein [Spirochaetota bacterium]